MCNGTNKFEITQKEGKRITIGIKNELHTKYAAKGKHQEQLSIQHPTPRQDPGAQTLINI